MKNKIIITAFLILILNAANVFSQSISGVVYESEEHNSRNPIPGVTVYWLGTSVATSTDAVGKFKLSKQGIKDFRLIFSLLGHKTDTVSINPDDNKISHQMTHSNVQLSQVEINEKQEGSYISKIDPRKTQIVTTTELYKAACCNLSESFETNASVDVTYSDAITGAKQIQLLGLSGIYSQIQTENIPLIRGLATPYGLNYIPGSWMQSIQVSKGTSSVINGYESVTGQINIEYKKPVNAEKLFVNIYGNEKTRLEANLYTTYHLSERLSTMLMVHGDYFNKEINKIDSSTINAVNPDDMSLIKDGEGNPIQKKMPENFLDIPKLTTINLFNRWDYTIPNKICSQLGIKYMYEDRNGGTTDFDKNTFALDTAKINDGTLPYGFGMKTSRVEAFLKNGFMFQGKPWKSVGLILSGIYHDQKGYFGVNDYTGIEKSVYGNLIYQSIFGNTDHKFSTGASFLYDDYIENYKQIQFTYIYQTLPSGSPLSMHDVVTLSPQTNLNPFVYDFNRSQTVAGAFFEYTYTHSHKFSLILGLRGDYSSEYGFFATPRTNIKCEIIENLTLRGSAGLGYRSANIIAENMSVLASQKIIKIQGPLDQEMAANYGLNLIKEFQIAKRKAEIDLDVYRTDFFNQVVVDLDNDPAIANFYNLQDSSGKSFANSYQIQFSFEPIKSFTVLTAFRINDVKQTTQGKLQQKAFTSKYKGLLTLSYATRFDKWKFDFTTQVNGPARISDQSKMPDIVKRDYTYSPVYTILNAQISRKFKHEIDCYLGVENLLNFKQMDPITEGFLPYHTHFDTSMTWGPLAGRTIYAGVRYKIK